MSADPINGAFLSAHPDGQHNPDVAKAILDADETYMDGTKVCIGTAPAGTPQGPSLLEGDGTVGRKGKRDVRRGLLDGGPLQ